MVTALWEQVSFRLWPTSLQRSAPAEDAQAGDQKHEMGNCKIAEEVWNSAIYLGPGGPLLRDR